MRRALTLLGGALGLLTPLAAPASTWQKDGQSGSQFTTNVASPGGYYKAAIASATDDTEIIGVGTCENIDVGLVEDLNGNGTGATALTATLQWCPVNQNDDTVNTDGERDAACVDYASGTLTGDGTLQGAGIPSGFVRLNIGGTHAADPGIFLKCNGPSR